MLRWKVTTEATADPITVEDAKHHCRVDTHDDDAYIKSLIEAATTWCENIQGRAYITQTITAKYDAFPGYFELPRPPLQSVTSITYVDQDGTTQTVDSSTYVVDTHSEPGRITRAYEKEWPYDVRAIENAVVVTYVAGYGAPADVPERIKHAIRLMVAHWYEHREMAMVGVSISKIPASVMSLLNIDRVFDAPV